MSNLLLQWGLNKQTLPSHVGIIMDGNGRWASKQHKLRIFGHQKGVERVREITEFSGKIGIKALTLFAFSDENWRRPQDEVTGIMGLLRTYLYLEQKKIIDNNVQFRILGDRNALPKDILKGIDELESKTKKNNGMFLNVALSYGGQTEIVRTAKKMALDLKNGLIDESQFCPMIFESYLDTSGIENVDMLIRTSGEMRISNFLLWQIAYAELFFTNVLWPDFDISTYVSLLKSFAARDRRFGLVKQPDSGHALSL